MPRPSVNLVGIFEELMNPDKQLDQVNAPEVCVTPILSSGEEKTRKPSGLIDPALKNVRITFSRYCRSGIVGKLCGCWRCRGVSQSRRRFSMREKREAELVDRAFKSGQEASFRL